MTPGRERRRAIIVLPTGRGGIARLFSQMSENCGSAGAFDFRFISSHNGNPLRFPANLARFLHAAAVLRPALCHINLSSRGSTLRKTIYGAVCRAMGLTYVLHLHGSEFCEFYRDLPEAGKKIVRWLFAGASRVIVLGAAWKDFVVDEIGVAPHRAVILPNAVSAPAKLVPAAVGSPPVILFLGRLGARKGIPELLDALASPQMRRREWRAVIAGDGDVAAFARTVEEAGISARIALPGWVGPSETGQLLSSSDILVLPARAENLPLSMLEGMGYGLCPVVTPVGAVPDVIRHGENGMLVPVGDSQALAAALVRLIDDPALRTRLGANARAEFEARYDMRHYREKLEAIYRDVLGRASAK